MGITSIEWTSTINPDGTANPGYTFNPWLGCQAISPACDHCYAETLVKRWGGDFAVRRRTAAANWKLPIRWNAAAEKAATRRRVFCASLADVFDNQVPVEWRYDLWALIRATPWLQWQLLTKRPQNIAKMLPPDWGHGFHNVWLGTTVENQTEADRRIPILLSTPAAVRFLSCEPLLGPVDLRHVAPTETGYINALSSSTGPNVSWLIAGGESGPHARPMHPDWARSLRDQCKAAGVPYFYKQNGEWFPDRRPISAVDNTRWQKWPDGTEMHRVGKKAAGSLLDGVEHKEFPCPRPI